MKPLHRLYLGLLCLTLFAYCLFGFLAGFEESPIFERLPWTGGYWLVAAIALGGIAFVIRTAWRNVFRGGPRAE